MVEAVGHIERQLIVGLAPGGAFLHGPVDVDDQVATPSVGFAGDGVVAEADDVGGAVLPKIFPVGLRDAPVVNEDNADFAPGGGCGFGLKPAPEPVSQLLELW